MKRHTRLLTAVPLLLLAIASTPAHAQTLVAGRGPGTVNAPAVYDDAPLLLDVLVLQAPALPDPGAVKAALVRERAKYPPVMRVEDMGAILNAVALQFPNMGMHRKAGGKISPLPGTLITVSADVLRVLPPGDDFGYWSDVLGSTGTGAATPSAPTWARSTDDRASFVAPVGVVPPPPPPPQPPPATDLTPRVVALEQAVAALRDADVRAQTVLGAILDDVEVLKAAPVISEDRIRQLIAAAFASSGVQCTIGRTLGHVHSCSVTLVPR